MAKTCPSCKRSDRQYRADDTRGDGLAHICTACEAEGVKAYAQVSDASWNGSASNYDSTEAYCAACLIDENSGSGDKVQSKCHLPVREPGGKLNKNGVHAAAQRLGAVKVSGSAKAKAARKLRALYSQLGEEPPESLKSYAEPDAPLETVDIERIEWMAADARIFGSGACPAAGEVYSAEYLEHLAANTNEVLDELRPYNKLGHSEKQRLARASGLYTEDDEPATGWLTDWRVEEGKLVSSAKAVPKALAKLFEAGAYRVRSPEITSYRSQESGKDYEAVVRAGAWLGTTAPAFKTLEDVYALYHDGEPPTPIGTLLSADQGLEDEEVLALEYAQAGELIWDPEASFCGLQRELQVALNPGPDLDRYYVSDVSFQVGSDAQGDPQYKALVNDYRQNMTWVVPFDIEGDRAVIGSDWQEAEQAWVAAKDSPAPGGDSAPSGGASDYREGKTKAAADTPAMPDDTDTKPEEGKQELNEETRGFLSKLFGGREVSEDDDLVKLFAEAAGVPEETDPEKIRAAITGVKEKAETPPEERLPEGVKAMSESELSELQRQAKAGEEALKKLYAQEREFELKEAMREGKFDPAEKEDWEKRYDENPDWTKGILEKLPAQDKFKTFGADDAGGRSLEGIVEALDEDAYRAYCEMQGLPFEERKVAGKGEEAKTP